MKKFIELGILLLFALYVGLLYGSGKMTFFIHPRYVNFTYAFALVAVFIALVGLIRLWEKRRHQHLEHRHHHHDHTEGKEGERFAFIRQYGLLIMTLAVAFILPVKPLSIATAQQREIDFNSLSYNQKTALDSFFRDSEGYELGDWVVALNYDPNPSNYLGKKVQVSGFAYKSEILPVGSFRLARFVITCCAVDARPVGLLVKSEEVSENTWYRVKGEFAVNEESGELIIVPNNIEKIDEPKDPYIF